MTYAKTRTCGGLSRRLRTANSAVSRAESIRRFRILPAAFTVGTELTPPKKVRRDYVLETYATDIDVLYA